MSGIRQMKVTEAGKCEPSLTGNLAGLAAFSVIGLLASLCMMQLLPFAADVIASLAQ
jgi:hypothetical protein